MRSMAISLLVTIILFFNVSSVHAAEQKEAKIVGFNVTLNGVLINNANSEYPLLIYKDIAYFPMTWDMARFMGLEQNWEASVGLTIKKASAYSEYKPLDKAINDSGAVYPVVIPEYQIKVNGELIDNKMEEHPLINYNGVTYFPLTWEFAVDSFGWNYNWSKEEGLIVTLPGAKPPLEESALSALNKMYFGQGYSFEAKAKNAESNEVIAESEGKVDIIFNKDIWSTSVKTNVELSVPVEFKGVLISGISETFSISDLDPTKYRNPFPSIGYIGDHNLGRTIGPELNGTDIIRLLTPLVNLRFIGNEREKITSIGIKEVRDGVDIWELRTKGKIITNEFPQPYNEILAEEKVISFGISQPGNKIEWITIEDEELVIEYLIMR